MASDNFLSRWSKRKIEGHEETEQPEPRDLADSEAIHEKAIDESVIETNSVQTSDSDENAEQPQSIASLLASQAAKETKKAALRKLFLSGEFSEVDRLNDYDHDYSSVKPLASEVAEKLRQWVSNTTDEAEQPDDNIVDESSAVEQDEAETIVEHQLDTELKQQELNSETKNTT